MKTTLPVAISQGAELLTGAAERVLHTKTEERSRLHPFSA